MFMLVFNKNIIFYIVIVFYEINFIIIIVVLEVLILIVKINNVEGK